MATLTFATATTFQRIQMIEEALEKVLDRGGMFVEGDHLGHYVLVPGGFDCAHEHSLHDIARELEALLP
ncbi:hypothetical protein [Paracoccus denitrificans]|uniref:hypothetical protein n=1 Tax=Paracoccus denitrificans TaxID=266 RepID=UPI003364C258